MLSSRDIPGGWCSVKTFEKGFYFDQCQKSLRKKNLFEELLFFEIFKNGIDVVEGLVNLLPNLGT